MTDKELIEALRSMMEDQKRLETSLLADDVDITSSQAAAYVKIRRLLRNNQPGAHNGASSAGS